MSKLARAGDGLGLMWANLSRPVSRSAILIGLLTLGLALGVLEGCGGSEGSTKQAVTKHPIPTAGPLEPERTVGEFGKLGTGAGEFREAFGIATDQHSGDMYVVDNTGSRIERFTRNGSFLLAWGWGVADGKSHTLQTCTKTCFAGFRGEGTGQFNFPEGVAVDNDPSSPSYRDVYVVDIHNYRVEKFNRRGRFLLAFGGGVNRTARKAHDHAHEDVCPVHPSDVCGAGRIGPHGGQLDLRVEGSFIAVAPGGVYVGTRNHVKVFSANGKYLSQITLTPDPEPSEGAESGGVSGLAVNASGQIYVIRNHVVGINLYAPSGKLLQTLNRGGEPSYPEGPTPSMALDPAGNLYVDVYAQYQHRIDEYSSSGVKIATFDRGRPAEPGIADKEDGLPGMTYNPRTKKLYLVNADVNVTPRVERVRIVEPPSP